MLRVLIPLVFGLALIFVAAPPVHAEDDLLRAASVTERGRDVDRILDMILAPPRGVDSDERVVVLLLDVTASLQKSDFAGELDAALERNARTLAGTKIGVARAGAGGRLVLKPTTQRDLVAQCVRETCAEVDAAFQDVYADVRRILPAVKREKGAREIVLVTFENGDAESELEPTVQALRRGDVRLSVICREAFLSDAYWILRPPRGPSGTRFTGSDGAFVDMPWGIRFQWGVPNNGVLSGYAMFGLTRMAAATGGRVYLYYPPTGVGHVCCGYYWCRCLFCRGDHTPEGEVYQAQRLKALGPLAESREDVLQHALADPYYRLVQEAWEQASRNGLVYSRPSIDGSVGAARVERYPYRGWTPLGTTVSFPSEVMRANRILDACDRILKDLDKGLARAREQGGLDRYRAVAETTRLLLHVTRFNLLHYVAFCRDVAPELATRRPSSYDPPERSIYGEDARFRGIGYINLSLCHGVAPFRSVRFPGGADLARELFGLQVRWDAYMRRWNHTPWAMLARRFALARYYLVVRPGYVPPGKRRVPDTKKDETVTLPARPARPVRPGGSSGQPGDGPTSGG
jgi:hypothetical protein